jgi:hypothetical protein
VREPAGKILGGGARVGSRAVARIEELLAESERPAAERVQGVAGHVIGETTVPKQPYRIIVIAQDRQAHGGPALEDLRRPGVAEELVLAV